MNLTEHLTQKERMARVGQLLAKGITLMLMREAEAKQQAEEAQAATKVDSAVTAVTVDWLDDDHRRILEFLLRVGKSSPREMQSNLEVSKVTLFRRLRELEAAGLVERSGKTAAVRYQPTALARSAKQKHGTAVTTTPNPQGRDTNQP